MDESTTPTPPPTRQEYHPPQLERLGNWKQLTEDKARGSNRHGPPPPDDRR